MKRTKFSVNMRNKLSEIAMSVDSCAAIEESRMTRDEREYIKSNLRAVVNFIDKKLF